MKKDDARLVKVELKKIDRKKQIKGERPTGRTSGEMSEWFKLCPHLMK